MAFFSKLFGDANKKYIDSLLPVVAEINALESQYEKFSDAELRGKTEEFKTRLAEGETTDDILPAAFAVVREAAKRTLGQRHFDVQLIGGIVLHNGQIAEMKTGEGKTLTSTLPIYLNALLGKGVHVVTVNDYLAKRDATWMGQIYDALGLSVSSIQHDSAFIYKNIADTTADQQRDQGVTVEMEFLQACSRQEAYAADITYGTNNEFGFDYLRDNMVASTEQMVQRDLHYAIVDEVDSILVDEARTPLIISAPAEESADEYYTFARLVKTLRENADFNVDEKLKAVTLTEDGINRVEKALGVQNIYQTQGLKSVHHLEEALKAEVLFKKDRNYVVKDGEIIIVDEFTGRLMQGRRYSGGLHQAIEAKEGVKIQKESLTLATITFQNYFRMYEKLAGMTGTAATESEEFSKIYKLDVTIIPTNQPIERQDMNDLIYQSEEGKMQAIVADVKKRYQAGQPVLIGTISIEKNEQLSELLSRSGVPYQLLNAKQHEREAEIIAQAGKVGAVTLATNMAGRGVDIILGGKPVSVEEAEKVKQLGGLHVIGTERHESRRIDNQLRGRAGRQGDPGSSQFFVSLDDDLMRVFGSERMKSVMRTMNVPEDMPIENTLISKSIENAQTKVEGHNFDIRKHLVEYDDVMNKQRATIYRRRRSLLSLSEGKTDKIEIKENDDVITITSLRDYIIYLVNKEVDQVISFHSAAEGQSDAKEIIETLKTIYTINEAETKELNDLINDNSIEPHQLRHKLIEKVSGLATLKYDELEKKITDSEVGVQALRRIELMLLLRTIDNLWIEHLQNMDYLRQGIGLRGYGQRDPLVEYKKEGFVMYNDLLDNIQNQVVYNIFKLGQTANIGGQDLSTRQATLVKSSAATQFASEKQEREQIVEAKPRDAEGHKVGRNDPCPCGSGKKFKKCHGK
ncbi:MAG: preprotein translocase subunit SecA [Candidatus Komeilibacteria bacterium]|nr:preprotein translocase subunit SecA [Candidatus Komeilibacteria bacterium]